MTLALFLLLAQPLPLVVTNAPDTNRYYTYCVWDSVTNAQQYWVTVYSNSFLLQMVPAFTNWTAVSNLPAVLDDFEFRSYAVNATGNSDYSDKAPLHWSTVLTSNDLTNWLQAPAVQFDPSTNACGFLRLSNWNYRAALHRQ